MRIAINTRFLIKDKLEGLGWHNYELCKALVAAYPQDEFLFLFDRPFDAEFIFGENVKGIIVPPPARSTWLWKAWFEWSLPWVFRIWKPDVFLSLDGYCSLRSKVPTALVVHDIAHVHYPEQIPKAVQRYYDRMVPRFLNRADCILAISNFVSKDIQEHYPIDPAKIRLAPNALRGTFHRLEEEEQQATRLKYAEGNPYFFYIGAIHPRKNLTSLIQAFDQFKAESGAKVKLLIGGRFAWKTGDIWQAYEQAQHQKDILFLGYLEEKDLRQVLGAALALTYVSLFEGFGLPLLEAMHAEVPILTSNVSSMPEVVGDAAVLVDPHSVEEIAGGLSTLYHDAELRKDLIEKGRDQRTKFSWDRTARIVYENLERIAQKP